MNSLDSVAILVSISGISDLDDSFLTLEDISEVAPDVGLGSYTELRVPSTELKILV